VLGSFAGKGRFGAVRSSRNHVRVIDFHSVGSFELEQVLRQLERDETRGSLRRAGRSDRTNLEASVFSVDTQRFGDVYAITGNLAVGRVPEDWQ
jgi:hypothetical protein